MGSPHEENEAKKEAKKNESQDKFTGSGYRILRPIGRGGAGDVFEAEHIALSQRVVLKILRAKAHKRPDLVQRMRIEAMALSRIRHPNLVEVNDFGCTEDGRPFLVMELLHGHTLREELKARTRLPVPEAIAIIHQVLSGLCAVHRAGIVHRDIKLDNLFVCSSPSTIQSETIHDQYNNKKYKNTKNIKILDLGVAKVLAAGELSREPKLPVVRTDTGQSLGTPRFFSPEQALSNPVDARSDLYAVGAVLYTLIVGRGPFDHYDALYDLVRAHAHEIPEPPSSLLKGGIPIELDRIILKALAKNPADRYATAEAFSDALTHYLKPPQTPPPMRWADTEPLVPVDTAPPAKTPPIQKERPHAQFYRIAAFVLSAAASALTFAMLSHLALHRFFP